MADLMFGEKLSEYSAKHGGNLTVVQTSKYEEAKVKAIEIIQSGKYGIQESDFWILMNAGKDNKMYYSGLIISHNGCLKINDCLVSKFDPSCVSLDKNGYNNSLIYTYCSPEQGLYEVGEVSKTNCKNEYPYAMAFKRLFDRVVLKLSKLAYSGIYSDSEFDEFAQQLGEESPAKKENKSGKKQTSKSAPSEDGSATKEFCVECKSQILPIVGKDGKIIETPELVRISEKRFGCKLCTSCQKKKRPDRE